MTPTRERRPTARQRTMLESVASGGAIVVAKPRETEPLLRRGWVTAERRQEGRSTSYAWVRITPTGLRALAAAVDRDGLPELGPKPRTTRRVCADCGSSRWRFETLAAHDALAERLKPAGCTQATPTEASPR